MTKQCTHYSNTIIQNTYYVHAKRDLTIPATCPHIWMQLHTWAYFPRVLALSNNICIDKRQSIQTIQLCLTICGLWIKTLIYSQIITSQKYDINFINKVLHWQLTNKITRLYQFLLITLALIPKSIKQLINVPSLSVESYRLFRLPFSFPLELFCEPNFDFWLETSFDLTISWKMNVH